MSLDGFISDTHGGVDWLTGQDASNNDIVSYNNFLSKIDTVIMGYNTYRQIITELSPNEWPYKGMKSYVLTHRNIEQKDQIIFVNCNVIELVSELNKNGGKNIWICGGAEIVNQLMKDDVIDKYIITIIPTILGDGIRLFEKGNKEIRLQLIKSETSNGMIELVYKRR
jgi:dihydrofolate reductase